MNHQQLQEDFAELILKKGVNIQKDQAVMLRAPVEGAEFVRLLAKKAYELGAKNVHVNWADDTLTHLKFKHAKDRSEEHTSELQSRGHLVCRLLLEKKKERHC